MLISHTMLQIGLTQYISEPKTTIIYIYIYVEGYFYI